MILDDDELVYDYDSDFNFDFVSVFGFQVCGDVSDKFFVIVQLVGCGSEDYDVDFEWVYMIYMLNNNFNISVGCLCMFLFKYFVLLDIGYLYYWLILLDVVYGIDFNNIDGVCVDYMNYLGDWEYGVQFIVGCVEVDIIILGMFVVLELENVVVVLFEVICDWFSVCILLVCGKISVVNVDFDIFVGGLN